MGRPCYRHAGPICRLILHAFGFAAIYTPWRTAYILAEHYRDPAIRAHEAHHDHQRTRDGFFTFWLLICYYFIRFGHEDSPYEIEARQAERHHDQDARGTDGPGA